MTLGLGERGVTRLSYEVMAVQGVGITHGRGMDGSESPGYDPHPLSTPREWRDYEVCVRQRGWREAGWRMLLFCPMPALIA